MTEDELMAVWAISTALKEIATALKEELHHIAEAIRPTDIEGGEG